MLEDLRRGPYIIQKLPLSKMHVALTGTHKLPGRMLAVLTRNNNGPIACLNLLRREYPESYERFVEWGLLPD